MKRLLRATVILTLLLGAAYLLIAFNYGYSDGNRAGYIQKFSNKGWVCKTHEGELAMTTFSVGDTKVASQLSESMGKRLVLHYKEYRYLPSNCFGETAYFVDRVEVTE